MAERITGHTELIGLMAYPIRHSSSPAMQNEAFAEVGADYAYLAFEVGADEIEDAVKAIRTLKMRGSNVSMPNKTLVGQYLDELDPAAELCGAVNTIVNDNGHLKGYITDGIGFMAAIKDNDIDPMRTLSRRSTRTQTARLRCLIWQTLRLSAQRWQTATSL